MLVPRSRLLVWVAIVVVPFALLGGLDPAAANIALGAVAALGLVVLVDAFNARTALADVGVQLPEIARFSQNRESKLEVRIRNPRLRPKVLRLALGLPPEIQSGEEVMQLSLPAESEWSRLSWVCQPRKRGRFPITAAYFLRK